MIQPHYIVYYDPEENCFKVDVDTTVSRFSDGNCYDGDGFIHPVTQLDEYIDHNAYIELKGILQRWNDKNSHTGELK